MDKEKSEDVKRLEATLNTFNYWFSGKIREVCPKCGEYILIDGYTCFGCGFDRTANS